MKIRLTALMLLAVTAMFVFSGCSLQMKTPDELMSPPKIAGGYQNLQDSFEAVAGENVELETPMNGEHKSAFIIDDFDSDGNEDAMVFYSEKGKKSTVNIGIFNKDKDSDKWDYIKSVKGLGNSVDTVVLDDMNGDGLKEVVVGWNLLNLSKQLSVYEPSTLDSSNYFYEMGSFQYSLFDMIDIDSDSHKELFFVNLENTNNVQSASAQAAKISKDGKKVESVGKTALDGKAGTAVATASANGLMSKDDKAKLDGITGQVTIYKLNAPDHATDLVQYGAFQVAAQQIISQIPTVPTALKNPNALTIKIGSTTVTYDGSAAKTVEIADGSEVRY